MNRTYLAAVLSALALVGCAGTDRYELSKDSTGRLVRLDTRTGEVALVEGDRLTPIKGTAAALARTGPQVALPEGGKSWPALTSPLLGDTGAALTTSWQDGKLHYVIELYPLSKRLKLVHSGYYSNSFFSVEAYDAAGKQVARIDLPTSRLARTVSNARNMEELSAGGDIAMTKMDYASLASWRLLWNP